MQAKNPTAIPSLKLCATRVATLRDPSCNLRDPNLCCDSVRPKLRLMIWPCSTHDSTLFDSWFDPVWLMIQPCSSLSTLFESWFDPVRLMIRTCSTHDSTLFDAWFDPARVMIRPCLTPDSTMFDSIGPVRLMIRPCSTYDSTLFDYGVRSTVLICD